jgi:hypothetical protein
MAYDVVTKINLRGLGGITQTQAFPAPPAPSVVGNVAGPTGRTRSSMWHPDSSGPMRPPVYTNDMLWSDIGSTGLRQWSGWVREEFLPQLQGRQAARVFREMKDNSSVIGSLVFAIDATMRRIEWRVDPADDSGKAAAAADFFDGCRDDMSHTWPDFIIEMQSMLTYGYAPMEVTYKRCMGKKPKGLDPNGLPLPDSQFDDGKLRWRKIALRGQDTVIKWFFDANGAVSGMTQQPWQGPLIDIPIEKLLLFRPMSHKNNPEGRSILRSAYRSWYMAKRLEEMEAIVYERMGGIPTIYIPNDILEAAAAGDVNAAAKLAAFKNIATNVRVDEQMGLVLPSDLWEGAAGQNSSASMYRFELVTPQHGRSTVDADKVITRYNVNMLASVMADFLQLGHESRGTQALSQNKTDMFFNALEGFLIAGSEVLNRFGIPRLGDLNGMDPKYYPSYAPDMPQRLDLDVLGNFVFRLSQAGMPLFPNEVLEEYLADAAGWPDISEDNSEAHAIVGPAATMEIQENQVDQQTGEPQPGSPKEKLAKIILGSMRRRGIRMSGGSIVTKRAPMRARRRVNGYAAT